MEGRPAGSVGSLAALKHNGLIGAGLENLGQGVGRRLEGGALAQRALDHPLLLADLELPEVRPGVDVGTGLQPQRMKGGDLICDFLIQEGVPYVFGICGHGNVGLLDPLVTGRDGEWEAWAV